MTPAAPYAIRPYRPGDESVILPLLQATLGETAVAPRSQRFWSWKHLDNPFGPSFGLFAWDEQSRRALALRILMRWRFRDGAGGRCDAVRAVDTATAPECRRLGLFTSLTTQAVGELARGGTRFIFNTPNASSLPGYLKMGWQVVAVWPLHVQVVRPLRLAAGLARTQSRGSAALPAWEEFFRQGTESWGAFRGRCGGDVEQVVAAWERVRPRRGLRTERSVPYLDWRYGGHPSVTYAAVPVVRGGRLAGFAVLRPNVRFGLKEAVLAELFLREADPSLARELLSAVRRAVRSDYLIAHFAAGSFELSSLRRAWYLTAPGKGLTFAVRVLREGGTDPLRAGAWDLSAGDLEVF
ncbi:MAG TPA: GNAT family N-acetyltransferase [Candidatus Methanoperedens sp.]|nr:GNAT family N-acetyltransferase [Candidatus Methanoperedens sp.]